jgi:hypothetical protein
VSLAALLLLTLALKLCVIFAPPRELWPDGKGCDEELWRGTSAQELIDGPLLRVLDYQINDFSGGSFVIVLLDVPLFLVFGPTVAVMRLATIPFHLLAVACLFALLDRRVGRRAAWVGGLLLAVPPPGYAIVSATAWGTHMEGIALGLLVAWLFVLHREDGARDPRRAFVLGLAAGFALYFGYLALVLLAALALLELCLDARTVLRRAYPARLAGFAVGFSPWLLYNLTHDFGGLSLYNRGFAEHVGGREGWGAEARAGIAFLGRDQAASFHVPDLAGISGDALEIALFAILAGLAVLGAWCLFRRSRSLPSGPRVPQPATIALVYLPLFLLAYVASDFRVRPPAIQDYRYAMPAYPWLVVLAATAVACTGTRAARRASGLAIALLVLAFASGTLARCDFSHARASWSNPGHSDTVLARTIFAKFSGDYARLDHALDRLRERPLERQHQTLFVLGQNYKQMLLPETRYGPRAPPREFYGQAIDHLRKRVDPPFQPYFERPIPGERGYKPDKRDRFWKDWEARTGLQRR